MKSFNVLPLVGLLLVIYKTEAMPHQESVRSYGGAIYSEGADTDPCRGLPCEEFRQMEAIVAAINAMATSQQGVHEGQTDILVSTDSLLEGDIALTLEQAQQMLADMTGGNRKRSFYTGPNWKSPVHFIIREGDYSTTTLAIIRDSVQFWQDNTCIDFVEVTSPPATGNYLEIHRGGGCWSYLGSVLRPQLLSLGGGCELLATAIHELGHALGMYHEQSRLDRDNYINILYDNINSQYHSQFRIPSTQFQALLNVPYDLASIMHYGARYFTTNGLETIQAKDSSMTKTIKASQIGTFYDIKTINLGYQCSSGCPANLCKNGGIPNSRSPVLCSKCLCPEGFGGDFCETAATSSPGCFPDQAEIVATDAEQCVHSPNWPNKYAIGDACSWFIKAPSANKKIDYYFKGVFDITLTSAGFRTKQCYHNVEIIDYGQSVMRGPRFCGTTDPYTSSQVSEGDRVVVHFTAEDAAWIATPYPTPIATANGFQLCFKTYIEEPQSTTPTASTTAPEPESTTPTASTASTTTPEPESTTPTASTTAPDPCDFCVSGNTKKCRVTNNGKAKCKCKQDYMGFYCALRKTCADVVCKNGWCVNQDEGFKCKCWKKWKGKFCQNPKTKRELVREILSQWLERGEESSGLEQQLRMEAREMSGDGQIENSD